MFRALRVPCLLVAALTAAASNPALASDHGDTPLLINAGRRDALITDLHAFTSGDNLVIALCVNPAIPTTATSYKFASDLEFRVLLDNDSPVSFGDPMMNATYGGTVLDPARIKADTQILIRFNPQGTPLVAVQSARGAIRNLRVFTGLRDDPFIRGPRIGRNVAAIVLEFPLHHVIDDQPSLLIWATAGVRHLPGGFQDHAGRSLRSMFPENDAMNTQTPAQQAAQFGVPDVIIYDTSRPAGYPNGRLLTDDVVDLVGDPRVLGNDFPFPSENDLPFLSEFPYLAPPHQP